MKAQRFVARCGQIGGIGRWVFGRVGKVPGARNVSGLPAHSILRGGGSRRGPDSTGTEGTSSNRPFLSTLDSCAFLRTHAGAWPRLFAWVRGCLWEPETEGGSGCIGKKTGPSLLLACWWDEKSSGRWRKEEFVGFLLVLQLLLSTQAFLDFWCEGCVGIIGWLFAWCAGGWGGRESSCAR